MWRRLRWVLLALLVALVAAIVTAIIVEKPTLDDDEQTVDARWSDLRGALEPRYAALDRALTALDAMGERDRAVARDLATELAAWTDALDGGSPARQTEVANRLEGQGRRLQANVLGSPRLAQSTELTDAVTAFGAAQPSAELVDAYNRAVQTYEDDRTDVLRRVVTILFGFDARPLFSIPS